MIETRTEIEVLSTPERIFDLVTDLDHQELWLTKSSSFRGTFSTTENPAILGTTYVEPGPLGVRRGKVAEYDRPRAITFHQPMTLRLRLGRIGVLMRYTLTAEQASTHVRRVVTISIPLTLRLFQPLVVRAFRLESERTLRALKDHLDERSEA